MKEEEGRRRREKEEAVGLIKIRNSEEICKSYSMSYRMSSHRSHTRERRFLDTVRCCDQPSSNLDLDNRPFHH
jgi:hypothetical protein